MPVFRRPDGKIVETKTENLSGGADDVSARVSVEVSDESFRNAGPSGFDAPTRRMDSSHSDTNTKTRLVGRRQTSEDQKRLEDAAAQADAMDDPVVGWLAVIDGPGKGRSLPLGLGTNTIGRGDTERISLNFGDDEISRSTHTVVTYDPRGRKFYVQHGGGKNLTYVNERPVLAPAELEPLAHIVIGNTTLRFVPLCGENFDWQDTEGKG
ncbi:MAG: FHA domain-containing protein [Gammaproteobacteria bacterium]